MLLNLILKTILLSQIKNNRVEKTSYKNNGLLIKKLIINAKIKKLFKF